MRDKDYNIIVVRQDCYGKWGHLLYVDKVPNPSDFAEHVVFPDFWFPDAPIIQDGISLSEGFVFDVRDSKLYRGVPGQKAQDMESVEVPEELHDVVDCLKMLHHELTYGDVADILTERGKK